LRYFIELSYNGKCYHGWQRQPNAISVQEILENGLSKLLKTDITIFGAGRTDAGVHAKQMYAHFDINFSINREMLVFKLNSFLPKDICVQSLHQVTSNTHARFNAISREYYYLISLEKNVFNYENSYYFKKKLNIQKMNEAAVILYEYKNFKCFSRSNTDVKTYNCNILLAKWVLDSKFQLVFTIQADRFLRNMVRAIVGTMIDVGLGITSIEEFHDILKSKDRRKAGASAPAHGLFLSKIVYDNAIFLVNDKSK
jgi:tRNA pseudouridine38-40 synthase